MVENDSHASTGVICVQQQSAHGSDGFLRYGPHTCCSVSLLGPLQQCDASPRLGAVAGNRIPTMKLGPASKHRQDLFAQIRLILISHEPILPEDGGIWRAGRKEDTPSWQVGPVIGKQGTSRTSKDPVLAEGGANVGVGVHGRRLRRRVI